jgi:hypothetical protein
LKSSRGENRTFWFVAAAVVMVGFAMSIAVSWNFFQRNVFYSVDNVFDADPAIFVGYALGFSLKSRRHPLLMLFTLPLSGLAGLGESLLHWPLRTGAAILYGPAVAAVKSVLLMLTMRQFSFPVWWSALIALADILSLARLTVGSLTESYGPTSTAFAWLFFLCACAITGKRIRLWVWICCGLLLGGITITNVVPWALVLGCTFLQEGSPLKSAIVRTLSASAVAMLGIVALYGTTLLLFRPHFVGNSTLNTAESSDRAAHQPQMEISKWARFRPGILATSLPLTNAYAFAGPQPDVGYVTNDGTYAIFPGHLVPRQRFDEPKGWTPAMAPPSILVYGLLSLGLLGWFTGMNWNRQPGIPALLVVSFQYALLCLFGTDDLMLYVLHWQTALLIIMAGAWLCRGWIRGVATADLLATIACEIVMNSRNIVFAMHVLDAQFIPK